MDLRKLKTLIDLVQASGIAEKVGKKSTAFCGASVGFPLDKPFKLFSVCYIVITYCYVHTNPHFPVSGKSLICRIIAYSGQKEKKQ